jgi:putative SOS response-associated peptidase YedK
MGGAASPPVIAMCGRYKLSTPGDELWESFDLHGEPVELPPHFNIAPTALVAVIRTPHELEFLRWGLKVPKSKASGFNVRVESLSAPFYREPIRQRRCLILADGFYEWKAREKGKQPFLVQRSDGKPLAFAGIWNQIALENGELVNACAILTTRAAGVSAEVHDRMPLILPAAARELWLDPNARYRDLLAPDVDRLELVPVSTLVNSAKNDDARLVERVPG